jgi:Protein of unknown function, DUF547
VPLIATITCRLMKNSFVLLAIGSFFLMGCKIKDYPSTARPADHSLWDSLLQTHVSATGTVDYPGFIADSLRLRAYLGYLSRRHPNVAWTREEQLAYWINAYNAFTVDMICRHYPVKSIKDIRPGIPFVNTVWDIKFIHIERATYDLNNLEHGIIRAKFQEPRIHFALNCASNSCPKLRNRAYTPQGLNNQLEKAASEFINDPSKNLISADQLQLSRIFLWYGGDFKKAGGVLSFVNRYSKIPSPQKAKMNYLDYDWRLNE